MNNKYRKINYPGIKKDKYIISENGEIYNLKTKKIMKTYLDKYGYKRITLVTDAKHPTKRGNKSKHYFIHRLVAWEFIGPPPNELKSVVNHIDGDKTNNIYTNLEWCTVLENTNHAKINKLMNNSGVNAKCCKFSEKLVRKICQIFENGYIKGINYSNADVYEILVGDRHYKNNISVYDLIKNIHSKKSYFDIISEYKFKPPESFYLSDNITLAIDSMIFNEYTNIEILNEFGITNYTDNKVLYNKIIRERVRCKVIFNDYRNGIT